MRKLLSTCFLEEEDLTKLKLSSRNRDKQSIQTNASYHYDDDRFPSLPLFLKPETPI
jgi:hypothetical protein